MRYCGIDLSTKTGLVLLDRSGELIDCMEITEKGPDPGRMIDIIERTTDQLECDDVVAIEGFAYGAKGAAVGLMYGLGWGLRMELNKQMMPYYEVAPSAVKKFCGAKGNAKKDELAVLIYKRWGFEHPSDNVRDAYVLAQIARAVDAVERGMPIELTAYQREVVATILNPPKERRKAK